MKTQTVGQEFKKQDKGISMTIRMLIIEALIKCTDPNT